MAGLEQLHDEVKAFNEKYNLSFSIEAYETTVLKIKNLKSFFAAGKEKEENIVYKSTLLNLYRESVENRMANKTKTLNHIELINDFEKLMDSYRQYCKENNKPAPGKRGGWKSGVALLEDMKKRVSDIKMDKGEHMKDNYLAGKIRLRDMRASVEKMKNSNPISAEELAEALVYSKALKATVKDRSIWWKARHMIRNNAEQRDLKALEEFLNSHRGTKAYADAIIIANEKVMLHENSALDASIERNKLRAQEVQDNKEKVEINQNEIDANVNSAEKDKSSEKVNEAKIATMADMMKL